RTRRSCGFGALCSGPRRWAARCTRVWASSQATAWNSTRANSASEPGEPPMPADYERAFTFIFAHGSAVERYVLNNLAGEDLYEAPPATELDRQLLAGQRADGGWAPFWALGYSSLDATCYRLAQAEMAELALPQGALEFLRSRQRSDG